MFDPKSFKQNLRISLPSWSEAQLEEYTQRMAAKYLTVKKGVNVIHLDYLGGMMQASDLAALKMNFESAGLEFSSFDKSGIPYNALQDYQLQSFIAISSSIIGPILVGIGPNAAWDAIKYATLYTWRRFYHARTTPAQQSLNFGLKIQLGQHHNLDFKLDGDISEQTALSALDKALELMRDTAPVEKPQFGNFFVYNAEKQQWCNIDVMATIRQTIKEKNPGQ